MPTCPLLRAARSDRHTLQVCVAATIAGTPPTEAVGDTVPSAAASMRERGSTECSSSRPTPPAGSSASYDSNV